MTTRTIMKTIAVALFNLALAYGTFGRQEPQVSIREASIHLELSHSRRAQTEISYWEARDKAQAEREKLPASAFTIAVTDLGDLRRIWDFYTPDYNCPLMKERIGRLGDGGKWLCGVRALLEDRPCLVYSLGSAGDTSFERDILNRTSCQVHTFDPTLSADTQKAMQAALPEMHFHAIGVGRGSGPFKSLNDGAMHDLEDILAELGHSWVDVLKMDIEGHEWDVLSDFYAKPGAQLPATQLLVEFHWPGNADRVWKVCPLPFTTHHDLCQNRKWCCSPSP